MFCRIPVISMLVRTTRSEMAIFLYYIAVNSWGAERGK